MFVGSFWSLFRVTCFRTLFRGLSPGTVRCLPIVPEPIQEREEPGVKREEPVLWEIRGGTEPWDV